MLSRSVTGHMFVTSVVITGQLFRLALLKYDTVCHQIIIIQSKIAPFTTEMAEIQKERMMTRPL